MQPRRKNQEGRVFEPTIVAAKRGSLLIQNCMALYPDAPLVIGKPLFMG